MGAGPHLVLPWESVAAKLSLKVQEMQVGVETKTSDDVFVKLLMAVQYHVIPERAKEAYYELANPIQQIESYVFDEVRLFKSGPISGPYALSNLVRIGTPICEDAWHPDVFLYEIRNRGGEEAIAFFYADLFPREGKFGHAAAFPLINGQLLDDGHHVVTSRGEQTQRHDDRRGAHVVVHRQDGHQRCMPTA